MASSNRPTAAASPSRPVNGRSSAWLGTPRSSRALRTSSQHHPSWNAPCTKTTVVMLATLTLDAHALQFPAHRTLDRRAVEERRVGRAPERHRVLEGEGPEVGLGGVTVLDE